jgi:type I restriction enzyme S subunit
MIPNGWAEVELGDIAALSAAPAKKSGGSRYVIVDMGSVAKDGSLLTHKKTDESEDLLQVGDLVMPKDDIGGGQIIGKAIHIDQPGQFVLGDHVYRLRLSDGHPPYVRYAINSYRVNMSLRSKVVGSAQLGLGRRSVLEQEIPFPPLIEQRAIAETLSDAVALVESLDALIAKRRDMKQAAMQQLLTGRTRLPGFDDKWQEVRLGDHASFLKGSGLPKSDLSDDGTESCIHYGELFTHYGPVIENVTSRCFTVPNACRSIRGDVLMPGSDVTPRGLATASAVMVDGVVLGGDVIVIRPSETSLWGPYLASVIRLNKGIVLRLVKGSTVYHIHAKDLADIRIQMPRVEEQLAIADVLSDMDAEIDALVAQRDKADLMKQGMMQELLSGRVRLV